jgi:hypothetical protein
LGNLGTDSTGSTYAEADAINDAGTAVGKAYKYVDGIKKGWLPVRWDASGSATELGNLGMDSDGATNCDVYAINDSGLAVGSMEKYASSTDKGRRAVRWNASGTAATELASLDVASSGFTSCAAYAVNSVGTAVGYSQKYVNGVSKGYRAVSWGFSGTAATELDNLGTDSSGATNSYAYAVNDAGTVVGESKKYVSGSYIGQRAVIWLPNASVIDLNDLGVMSVSSIGSWTLTSAKAISADGWVAGNGTFDPDGIGPLASYPSAWVTQVGLGGSWTTPTGGTWGRGPNWSTGTPAMRVGNAIFNLNSNYTVALDRDESTTTMSINAGTVTIESNGHTLATKNGLNVAKAAVLQEAGTIVGDITSAGTITASANGPGTLNVVGNLANSGVLEFDILDLLNHDQIDVTGNFTAGGTIVVKLADGYVPTNGDNFDLMGFGSFGSNGYTFDLSLATLPTGFEWDTAAFAATGTISVVGVPEPSTLALLGLSVANLLACVWQRRKRTA